MAKANASGADLVVTQVRSATGSKPKHRATLHALGLRRIGATRTLPDRPEIRGMLTAVSHLVEVHEPDAASRKRARRATEETK